MVVGKTMMRVALHEAGHAVVCLGVRLPLVRLQLNPPRYDLAPGPHPRKAQLLALMGGGAAEELIFGDAIGTGSDDEQIRDLLEPGDDEAALRDQVRQLLRWNVGTVRLLAARLMRERALSGEDVEAFIRRRSR
jgi:hypothetical protein